MAGDIQPCSNFNMLRCGAVNVYGGVMSDTDAGDFVKYSDGTAQVMKYRLISI